MKQIWLRYAAKIDALGLRERILVFLGAVAILIELVNVTMLSQQFAKEAELSRQIKEDQSQIAGIQAEIRTALENFNHNPNSAKRAQLNQIKGQLTQMGASLQDMQKGLVSPDKMTAMLEDIFKQNGKLRLVSLRTLPATGLTEGEAHDGKDAVKDAAKDAAKPASGATGKAGAHGAADLVYKHGVEIVVEGNYLDLVAYMTALEGLPWQIYWGKAKLTVDESFKPSLTLTLYTLSLDKKWLNI
jgi:MSHA biogenesis protein MshJ